ncbi:MAG: NapC/NirT family cytochrome c [Candidatus Hydrogenedentes bacterium]|nr:NapC/NirT family cytochrome c [Candidatus Hydrogenedentota bacterium]
MDALAIRRIVVNGAVGLGMLLFAAAPVFAEDAAPASDPNVTEDGRNVHEPLYDRPEGLPADQPYYPSARECKQCHPDHYREWSVSPHAYGQLSPVFNAMQAKINKLTNSSNGDFCVRCHTQVGMNLKEDIFMSNIDRHPTSREGISCVVCHRINQSFGKISGRFPLVDGVLGENIFGPNGNPNFAQDFGNEITEKFGEGKVHKGTEKFYQLTESAFCGTCHDVNLLNGFRLEEAFSEFKQSPAARAGTTCHDCHMGVEQGKFSGDKAANYETRQIAKIGANYVGTPKKKTNHMFAGPDHSVIHPALYPHNDTAAEFASMREWLTFDNQAGWGNEKFEEEEEPARAKTGEATPFPLRWENIDERYEARDILNANLKLLEEYHEQRRIVLQNGYGIGEYEIKKANAKGLKFAVEVKNLTDGHSVPTGFIAERVVFLEVVVYDESGKQVYISGDLDPNYDVRDRHSLFVHNRDLPLDRDLFSLQSKFITRNERGSDREQVLAVNTSASPLPLVRPSTFAATIIGNPRGARIHKLNITPNGSRWPIYEVKRNQLTGSGKYTVKAKLVSGMVPVNLVDEIKDVGFDYGMSAHEVALGIRFGVGDVVDSEGNRYPKTHVEQLANENRYDELKDLYGVAGGHIVLDRLEFEIGLNAADDVPDDAKVALSKNTK